MSFLYSSSFIKKRADILFVFSILRNPLNPMSAPGSQE
jgi:hypothetical protein